MAYNLQSLITILEQILNPKQTRWILDDHSKPQLQSLIQKSASLQQIFENHSLNKIGISLKSEIRDAAHQAEDIIENYMVDQKLSSSGGVSSTFSTPDLHQVMQKLDLAMEEVVKLVEREKMSTASSWSGASFLPDSSSKNIVVGVDEDLLQLKDRLTGMQSKLEIIPIVGMGGIGKTTIARNLYQDPLIVSHFEFCAWTTISQDYNTRAILLTLLRCIIGKELDPHINKENSDLKDIFYKSLYGRRYLIVLDDMWSTSSWNEIRRCFPDNDNGSRIVVTTRESDVANSQTWLHQMQLLSESESWNLLRHIVFGKEDCSDVLQGIGAKIARDCGGLPLAIKVIGGLLSKVERSKHVWENIGKDVRAAIAESDEQFSNILSLSYDHLPNHLKSCFLYMAAFPEDYGIKASRLIHMWVGEGFIKSNGDNKSLEEEAEDYLKALMERNLVFVKQSKCNGKPKRYIMHDLLRDLCIKKADEERFLHVIKNGRFSNMRRVSVDTSHGMEDVYASVESMSLARSFIRTGVVLRENLSPAFFALRLLRVLDIRVMYLMCFPTEIFQLVNLRYLAFYCGMALPSGISRLQNLQTLIAMVYIGIMPSDVWELPELRHLEWKGSIRFEDAYTKKFVHKKLQKIDYMMLDHSLIKRGFFESIPNIKKLRFSYYEDLPSSVVVDLSHLHKLETLTCYSSLLEDSGLFLPTLRFPYSLRKLSLDRCVIFPEVLKNLCALPNLEVLRLHGCVFKSEEETDVEEWEVEEGDEFSSLQFLRLYRCKLVRWRGDETNFPKLRHLIVKECDMLEEIPVGIGEIPTLQLIELHRCSDSAVASAEQIVEVQQSEYDNNDLQLRISNAW